MICVDASLALKLVLAEQESELVATQWEKWQTEGQTVLSPWLFAFEIMAVLRKKVARGELTEKEGLEAWGILSDLGIELRHHPLMWERSWALAAQYRRPTTYDTAYLALAQLLDCDLWTADYRFIRALAGQESRLQSVSQVIP